jgi:dihydroorotate dehydrogenase
MSGLVTRVLHLFEPETAHGLAIGALKAGLGPRAGGTDDPILRTRVFGLDFPNPLGLAAGFDKNAEVPDAMLRLGFGFSEVGTITPQPQAGNPRPRVFRAATQRAVINRLGFNGKGLDFAADRLRRRKRTGIVGANIGKNKMTVDTAADYIACIARLAPLVDYLVINVSSPNTPGLRDLQEAEALRHLLKACVVARNEAAAHPPLLLKIAPDLDEEALAAIVEAAVAEGIDGLIVGNTTLSRPGQLPAAFAKQTGGLSGAPLFALATEKLRQTYKVAQGRVPLIGVGGISSGADAYEKIRAGAALVQLYSAMVFAGPGLAQDIKRDLAARLRADGFASVAEAVGVSAS